MRSHDTIDLVLPGRSIVPLEEMFIWDTKITGLSYFTDVISPNLSITRQFTVLTSDNSHCWKLEIGCNDGIALFELIPAQYGI